MSGALCPWCGRWDVSLPPEIAACCADGDVIDVTCEACERQVTVTVYVSIRQVARPASHNRHALPKCECGALLPPSYPPRECPVCHLTTLRPAG